MTRAQTKKKRKAHRQVDIFSAGTQPSLPCMKAQTERVQVYEDGHQSVSWHLGDTEEERSACALHVVFQIASNPATRAAMETVLAKLSRPSELSRGELHVAIGLVILYSSSKNMKRFSSLAKSSCGQQEATEEEAVNRELMLQAIQAWSRQWSQKPPAAVLLTTANRSQTASAVRRRMVQVHFRQAVGLRVKSPEFGAVKSALSWPLVYGWSGHMLQDPELDALVASITGERREQIARLRSDDRGQVLQRNNASVMVAPSDTCSSCETSDAELEPEAESGEVVEPSGGGEIESDSKVEVPDTIDELDDACPGGDAAVAPGASDGGDKPIVMGRTMNAGATLSGTTSSASSTSSVSSASSVSSVNSVSAVSTVSAVSAVNAVSAGCNSGGRRAASATETSSPRHGQQSGFLTNDGANMSFLQLASSEAEGGNATVSFWTSKSDSNRKLALKTAKDTPSAKRQLLREIDVFQALSKMESDIPGIVSIVEWTKKPTPMLLMNAEKSCLGDLLEGRDFSVKVICRVLDDVITAVGGLNEAGYFHRDIKPDNIFVSEDEGGVLGDFGLSIRTSDAAAKVGLGDGTPEYVAPETNSSGWTIQAELYAVFLCFIEALIGKTTFELFAVGAERLVYLESLAEEHSENVQDYTDELEDLKAKATEDSVVEEDQGENKDLEDTEEEDDEEEDLRADLAKAASDLESVRAEQHRLGVDMGEWVPKDDVGLPPLSFFTANAQERYQDMEEGSDEQLALEMSASNEAKVDLSKLFEGDWVHWMPRSTAGTDCKEGVRLAVESIVESGALNADPSLRPKTIVAARELLRAAHTLFEDERKKEEDD